MSINAPQMVNVTCPSCNNHYTAPIQSLIDVGSDPRLKALLLQGRINVGVCPTCGTAGMLGVPLTYHDAEKELLLCLVPQQLQMNEASRQRMIGDMTRAIINNLPAEQRKGYLLQPQIFLSLQSLVEAILEADGITPEMLQAQQTKIELISQMLQTVDDSLQLSALIGENETLVDYEFFTLLTLQINSAQQGGQEDLVERLMRLRGMLLERTEAGKAVAQEQEAVESALAGIDEGLTRDELLNRILNTDEGYMDQVLSVLVALARPLIDYQFFQLLTERINDAQTQGNQAEVSRLESLRDKILDATQELDAQVRLQTQQRAQLLREILQSSTPRDTIRAHIDEIDDIFMSVLAASIAQNQQEHSEVAERLVAVQSLIAEVLQESAPPELRFITQLMEADYPDGTREMLSANQAVITPQLIAMMEALVADFARREETEASEKLQGILAQAKLMG